MLTSPQLQPLLTLFQTHYPMSSLCSELLTIHQGQYVVRSIVQSAGMTLATALAAAADVETAEDHAKIRVLEALGLANKTASSFTNPSPAITVKSSMPDLKADTPQPIAHASAGLNNPQADKQFSPSSIKGLDTGLTGMKEGDLNQVPHLPPERPMPYSASLSPIPESASASAEPIDPSALRSELPPTIDVSSSVSTSLATMSTSPTLELPTAVETAKPSKSEKLGKRKAESFEIPPASITPSHEQSDRSEEIMKIGIEMKRLGWSTEQGREYLKRTYGKRSRQELDDAELLDFLHYLELQPAPLQTPF